MAHQMNNWHDQDLLYHSHNAQANSSQLHMPHGMLHTGGGYDQSTMAHQRSWRWDSVLLEPRIIVFVPPSQCPRH